MTMMSGAQMVVRTLEDLGVEHLFGYPGGAVLDIYDALLESKKIKHILGRHEQGVAHAADGYARATGKVGVPCNFRSWCYQHCNLNCNCIYGFNSNGGFNRSGILSTYWF